MSAMSIPFYGINHVPIISLPHSSLHHLPTSKKEFNEADFTPDSSPSTTYYLKYILLFLWNLHHEKISTVPIVSTQNDATLKMIKDIYDYLLKTWTVQKGLVDLTKDPSVLKNI